MRQHHASVDALIRPDPPNETNELEATPSTLRRLRACIETRLDKDIHRDRLRAHGARQDVLNHARTAAAGDAYDADNARKVLQAIMGAMEQQ